MSALPVPLPDNGCPDCGTALRVLEVRQDALLRHGGYGATLRSRRRVCLSCHWSHEFDQGAERPPR